MPKKQEDEALKLDNQLCFVVYSTAHAFNRAYRPILDALDLTYPQYLVMLTLWEKDGVSVKEIGSKLHLDSGTLTPLLKRLEAAGLVQRARDTADERQMCISLTPEGKALREKAKGVPKPIVNAVAQAGKDLQKLKSDLIDIRDRINDSVS
jgi:DNA-binding MarR family transcriptional regulator